MHHGTVPLAIRPRPHCTHLSTPPPHTFSPYSRITALCISLRTPFLSTPSSHHQPPSHDLFSPLHCSLAGLGAPYVTSPFAADQLPSTPTLR